MVAPRALILALVLGLTRLASPAAAADCVAIESFSSAKVGEFPPDWKPRKDEGLSVYAVRQEGPLRFLRASSRGLGIQAAKEQEWNLAAYPVLAWSWRPIEFPKGSDERKSKTNDSALSVYAVFPHSPVTVRALKYIWSAVVPVGAQLTSSKGLTQARVVRSGTEKIGQWVDEQVNVLDDYRKRFGESDVPKPAGIAVLTDSDDTKSSAQGDYANFRVCKP
jgi:hypothetical protein